MSDSAPPPARHPINWRLLLRTEFRRLYHLALNTGNGFSMDDCFTHAAGLAYFAVLSSLPLVLIAVALTPPAINTFLPGFDFSNALIDFIGRFFVPEVATWIRNALPTLLGQTPLLGGVGILLLLWSASNVFRQLDISISTIWGVYEQNSSLSFRQATRNVILGRLRSLLIILSVGGLFIFDNLIGLLLLLIRREIVLLPGGATWGTFLVQLSAYLVSLSLGVLSMALLYRYLPPIRVPWVAVLPGALLAALLNQIISALVSLTITGLFAGIYQAVGGPIALLLWAYWIGQSLLLGCELTRHYWLMFCQETERN